MNKTKIDWQNPKEGWKLDYTWNPVIGCRHGCSYCYAKSINDRFKFIPKWTEPQFFEERLKEPYKLKKPSTIFVGSMCDLFGGWVPNKWIEKVIKVTKDNPQHRFLFLTKNTVCYGLFEFPKNCWFGYTITEKNNNTLRALNAFKNIKTNNKKFLSIEPILSDFTNVDFSGIDWIIVGAMTGTTAVKPEFEWINSIKHGNIHYKNNIRQYLEQENG